MDTVYITLLTFFTALYPGNDFFQAGTKLHSLIHILISIVALSILTLAALQATLLQLQNRVLRNKSSSTFIQFLPPLQTMEKALFQIICLGFLFLSASLVTAFLLLKPLWASASLPKVILSLVAWCLFAILLYGRYQSGWRGFTATRLTFLGVGLLIVAYIGGKLMLVNPWN